MSINWINTSSCQNRQMFVFLKILNNQSFYSFSYFWLNLKRCQWSVKRVDKKWCWKKEEDDWRCYASACQRFLVYKRARTRATGGPSYQYVLGVQLHIAILSKCMGNLNFPYNVKKNNKIHRLPRVSCVVVTLCVYCGFWSGLDAVHL